MKKKIALFLALGILALSATACGGKKEEKKEESKKVSSNVEKEKEQTSVTPEQTTVSLKEISDKLLGEIKYDDKLDPMDEEMYEINFAGFPFELVKERIVYISSSGGTAEEITCLEVKDVKDVDQVKKALEERLEFQRASFKNYVPEEVKRIDQAVLSVKGSYVILSVSGEPEKAKEIIEGK